MWFQHYMPAESIILKTILIARTEVKGLGNEEQSVKGRQYLSFSHPETTSYY